MKSIKLNACLAILGIGSLFYVQLTAQSQKLSGSANQWIADQIFANECSGEVNCLTSWNPGEDFPSLGLGHFIWYRKGQQEIYQETFPDLIDYYHEHKIQTPNWVTMLPEFDSPWQNRDQFYAEFDGPRLTELRNFLHQTLPLQAQFIVQRQDQALTKILDHAPEEQHRALAGLYREIASSEPPLGRYALIDYVNFKGEGIAAGERYQNKGWGLLQVLQAMLAQPSDLPVLTRFADAAALVLKQRIDNAPAGRNEQRWLAGWLNRIDTYRPPDYP